MLQINDTILYGAEGACTVADITEQEVGGKTVRYYVLQPIYNPRSTVYVPVDNPILTAKMRRVLSKEEILRIIEDMPNQPSQWIEDEEQRKETYRDILRRGDRIELVRMIKALYDHQQVQRQKGKHLHAVDEYLFKEAEKMLYDEFALVLGIKPDQVVPFITHQITLPENA